jgi:hypothetical protein
MSIDSFRTRFEALIDDEPPALAFEKPLSAD